MKKENLIPENFLVMDSNFQKFFESKNREFPFNFSLNFSLLIHHIGSISRSEDNIKKSFADSILREYNDAPDLHGVIRDISVTKKNEKLIDNMMMFLFPSAFFDKQTFAASAPYSNDMFYASPKFRDIIKITDGIIEGELNIDLASYNFGKIISGYAGILSRFYDVHLNFDFPLVYKILDPVNGLDRYFKLNGAAEFVEILNKRKLKKFSNKDIAKKKTNIYDLE